MHVSQHIVVDTLNLQAKTVAEYMKQKENHSDIWGSQRGVA